MTTKSWRPDTVLQSCVPYLLLPAGTASDFIQFLEDAFGAKEISRHLRDNGDIANAEVWIDDTTLMLADVPPGTQPLAVCHYLYVPDVDATYKQALAVGATSAGAPVDQSYGDRQGGVKDKWGNTWWLGTKIAAAE